MKISGFVKNSFVDYPQKISAVIFTNGCNFNCWYCHNKHILKHDGKLIDEKYIFEYLNKRKGLIDAVVVSGGEPTLQADLEELFVKIKKMGYKTKLDTNGTNPQVLKNLIEKKLIDYIAMDIKSSFENYQNVCGCKVNIKSILNSIELIMSSNIDYEFRTTLAPEIDQDDIDKILKKIYGSKNYYLQKCNVPAGYVVKISNNKLNAEKFLEKSKNFVINCGLRGFN